MGVFSKITKPIKKALSSKLGKAALLAATYYYGPQAFSAGKGLRGLEGWKAVMPTLLNAPIVTDEGGALLGDTRRTILGKGVDLVKAHPYISAGIGAAGLTAAGLPDEEDLPEEFTDESGQQQYLANRALYEDEWSDWLMDMNPGMSKSEALDEVRSKPMFSEGGRVKAQGGLFAGQMPGRNPVSYTHLTLPTKA